jgi:L-lactate utilization protein LutC
VAEEGSVPPASAPPEPLEARAALPRADLSLLDTWRARWEELDGRTHLAASLEAAREVARGLVGDATVARWADPELDGIAAHEAPAADAEVSLILGDVAVADTGQVGWAHGPGRPRGVGVLPALQVVLLGAPALVPSLGQALERLGAGGAASPSSLVFVAGPSRTADIEQRVIRGVHAPREIDVVVFGVSG